MPDNGVRFRNMALYAVNRSLDAEIADSKIVLHDCGCDNIVFNKRGDFPGRANSKQVEIVRLHIADRLGSQFKRACIKCDNHIGCLFADA